MSDNLNNPFSVPPPPIQFSIPPPPIPTRIPQNYSTRGPIPLALNLHSSNLPGVRKLPPLDDFDGKRLRKSGLRKTVNYSASIAQMLQGRIWQRDHRDRPFLQPDVLYTPQLLPPQCYKDNPISSVTTAYVKTVANKIRSPVFCLAWTPEGRRLITGSSSGEFTLWNGLTFNFETILQAHDSAVRSMVWSHNSNWMITGDHAGFIKYWQSNMNNVKMFQAHVESVRGVSFSQSDEKFATCSDDGTIRIWDFFTNREEKVLRGHGSDVKCIDWHPNKGLLISGSKDNQQPIKLWDPKSGQSLATIHAHKSTVMSIKWNTNGNWVVTASRDHLVKLFDIRQLTREVQTFRGHKKEASAVAWHPFHESLFCSGGSDGSMLYWTVGVNKMVGAVDQAHDSIIWALAWHPLGEVLCSGSNDFTCKFWTRNRPGDKMSGKYNTVNSVSSILKPNLMTTDAQSTIIPGLSLAAIGNEDYNTPVKPPVTSLVEPPVSSLDKPPVNNDTIPFLNISTAEILDKFKLIRKVPYAKPINKDFLRMWNAGSKNVDGKKNNAQKNINNEQKIITTKSDVDDIRNLIPGSKLTSELKPESLLVFGQMIKVNKHTRLESAIKEGQESLMSLLQSGVVPEVRQHIRFESNDDPIYKFADTHLQKDQDLRKIYPFNMGNTNLFMNQDVDIGTNNSFNQNYGFPSDFQTDSNVNFNRQPMNLQANTSEGSRPKRPYYNTNLQHDLSFQQYGRHHRNRRGGPSTSRDFNFPRPFNSPQGPFQNYNDM